MSIVSTFKILFHNVLINNFSKICYYKLFSTSIFIFLNNTTIKKRDFIFFLVIVKLINTIIIP